MRILVIEDEQYLSDALAYILKKNNYLCDVSNDGISGFDNAMSNIYDAIILDIMLPKMSGFEVLSNLRKKNINTPIIMLSAKSETEDKIIGLDMGADDYLPKPFETTELLARLRALCRRRDFEIIDNILSFSDLYLDMDNLIIKNKYDSVSLTLKEGQLLELLMINKDIITSKNSIIEKLWGFSSDAEDNNVEVYISFLRKKLNILNTSAAISTVRGLGYKLSEVKHV